MSNSVNFEGVYPPVLTPFREDEVAHEKLAANLERLNEYPLAGYVMLGSTGEFPLLTEAEKERVLATAREHTPRSRILVAGTGGESTGGAIRLTKRAAAWLWPIAPPWHHRAQAPWRPDSAAGPGLSPARCRERRRSP